MYFGVNIIPNIIEHRQHGFYRLPLICVYIYISEHPPDQRSSAFYDFDGVFSRNFTALK